MYINVLYIFVVDTDFTWICMLYVYSFNLLLQYLWRCLRHWRHTLAWMHVDSNWHLNVSWCVEANADFCMLLPSLCCYCAFCWCACQMNHWLGWGLKLIRCITCEAIFSIKQNFNITIIQVHLHTSSLLARRPRRHTESTHKHKISSRDST